MKKFIIEGGNTLTGQIEISGDKNTAVALIPASLLSSGTINLENVPDISDVDVLSNILERLNCKIINNNGIFTIDSTNIKYNSIDKNQSVKLRASYYFMGAMLSRFKKVEIYFPGGCSIGKRPIDMHLNAFEKLGATIIENDGKILIKAKELIGTTIKQKFPSVGATINTILVSTLAKGTTIIENAAKEPQIKDLEEFLNKMGAKISGAGTDTITIEGVKCLNNCTHKVIPDRVEASTYLVLGVLIGKDLIINNLRIDHMTAIIDAMKKMKINFELGKGFIKISKSDNILPIDLVTDVYPGFITDIQQPFTLLLAKANGISTLVETIWENRFMHIPYLNEMGCNIIVDDNKITVYGPSSFKGKEVVATDLRGGVTMLVAGLIAKGTTKISEIEHILRGYENIVEKLGNIGANIKIINE
ncbi:MAG: UDP-N-acetylglucosamine 1-carboxyvinyltransferase [Bacilli bacterium]